MKHPLRALAAAIACSLGLAGCGGSDNQDISILVQFYDSVTGSQYPILKDGLKIQNANQTVVDVAAGTSQLYLPDLVAIDSRFDVKIVASPNGISCVPYQNSNTGTVGLYGITVTFVCTTQRQTIKGTVNGLTGSGLVLNNGNDTLSVAAGASTFTMPATVRQTLPYGITVLSQPAGQTCSVVNGTGYVVESDITNVVVNCVNNP